MAHLGKVVAALAPGQRVFARGRCVVNATGQRRIRVDRGWTTLLAQAGEPLLARMDAGELGARGPHAGDPAARASPEAAPDAASAASTGTAPWEKSRGEGGSGAFQIGLEPVSFPFVVSCSFAAHATEER